GDQVDARGIRQAHVEHDGGRRDLRRHPESLRSGRGGHDAETALLEMHGEQLPDRSVVVDDQDAVDRAHAENVNEITFPPPGRSPMRASPRCSRAIRATTASPSPLPRARWGMKGTKALSRSSGNSVRPGSATESSQPGGSSRTTTSTVP